LPALIATPEVSMIRAIAADTAAAPGGWTVAAPQGRELVGIVVTWPCAGEKAGIALMRDNRRRRQ
jgi:hypothetical protein